MEKLNIAIFLLTYAAGKLYDQIETKNPSDSGKVFAWDNAEISP